MSILRKAVAFIITITFSMTTLTAPVAAQAGLNLPAPGQMLASSPNFLPTILRGIQIHPDDPLQFDFILDRGDDMLDGDAFKAESTRLIKYFLAALTIPEDQMWVNLSPNEPERIIPDQFGRTEMGRDLLAQDYLLKQLSASLMYPEHEVGKKFWERVNANVGGRHAALVQDAIPMNIMNKIWIVPQESKIYEHARGAFIVESKLKVMLEEDYVALQHASLREGPAAPAKRSDRSTAILREILIPEIEREVNEGAIFAPLRQIYNAMLLATWYKTKLKDSLLGQAYVDRAKVDGVNVDDPDINQKIYDQYVAAFKQGAYDFIKEEYDPATQNVIPRKYFSGGADMADKAMTPVTAQVEVFDSVREFAPRAARASFAMTTPDAESGAGDAGADWAMRAQDIINFINKEIAKQGLKEYMDYKKENDGYRIKVFPKNQPEFFFTIELIRNKGGLKISGVNGTFHDFFEELNKDSSLSRKIKEKISKRLDELLVRASEDKAKELERERVEDVEKEWFKDTDGAMATDAAMGNKSVRYDIEVGDTLSSIADGYGISVVHLREENVNTIKILESSLRKEIQDTDKLPQKIQYDDGHESKVTLVISEETPDADADWAMSAQEIIHFINKEIAKQGLKEYMAYKRENDGYRIRFFPKNQPDFFFTIELLINEGELIISGVNDDSQNFFKELDKKSVLSREIKEKISERLDLLLRFAKEDKAKELERERVEDVEKEWFKDTDGAMATDAAMGETRITYDQLLEKRDTERRNFDLIIESIMLGIAPVGMEAEDVFPTRDEHRRKLENIGEALQLASQIARRQNKKIDQVQFEIDENGFVNLEHARKLAGDPAMGADQILTGIGLVFTLAGIALSLVRNVVKVQQISRRGGYVDVPPLWDEKLFRIGLVLTASGLIAHLFNPKEDPAPREENIKRHHPTTDEQNAASDEAMTLDAAMVSEVSGQGSEVRDPDAAMSKDVGGVDFNPALGTMDVRVEGAGVVMPAISPEMLDNAMSADGFVPVLIDVNMGLSVPQLFMMLGLREEDEDGVVVATI